MSAWAPRAAAPAAHAKGKRLPAASSADRGRPRRAPANAPTPGGALARGRGTLGRVRQPRPEGVRLFVYGTLRRGAPNHGLMAGATFVGPAQTEPRFRLFDLGPYPCVVGGGGDAIDGEVFAVGAALLRRLDRFEGHPTLFRRVSLPLRGEAPAEGYLWAGALPATARLVAGGRWAPGAGARPTAAASGAAPRASGAAQEAAAAGGTSGVANGAEGARGGAKDSPKGRGRP